MSKDLVNRTEELSLLGWSKDGAKLYSELLDNSQAFKSFSHNEIFLILFLVFLSLVFGSIFLVRNFKASKLKKSSPKKLSLIEDTSSNKLSLIEDSSPKGIVESRVQEEIITPRPLVDLGKNAFKVAIKLSNKAVDFISLDRTEKKPFVKHFSNLFQETSVDTNSLIEHGLLATLLTYEASTKALKSLSPSLDLPQIDSISSKNKAKLTNHLSNKSELELRHFFKGSQLLSGLQKDKLIELILSNPSALEKATFEVREAELKEKTVVELKSLLQGQEKISRLRKSELIERVLILEFR